MRRLLRKELAERELMLGLDERRVLAWLAQQLGVPSRLGVDALRVLCFAAQRLKLGQDQYGKLDLANDKRSWARERAEEAMDLTVYSACEALSGKVRNVALVDRATRAAIALLKRRS